MLEMNISEVASLVKISESGLRKWERDLDIYVPRLNGIRYYEEEHIDIFLKVKELKEINMSLTAIKSELHKNEVKSDNLDSEQLNISNSYNDLKSLREKVFIAQYHIDKNKSIDFKFSCNEQYIKLYEIIFNNLKGDPNFRKVTNVDFVYDYVFITNVYRKSNGLKSAYVNEGFIKNGIYKIYDNNNYKYFDIEIKDFHLYSFFRYTLSISSYLKGMDTKKFYKELETGKISSPLLLLFKNEFLDIEKKGMQSKEYKNLWSLFVSKGI